MATPQFNQNFDGKLTAEQLQYLIEHSVDKKQIRTIEHYLTKYRSTLTDYRDLVGDNLVPDKMFYLNMKLFGYLLKEQPDQTLSKAGMEFRKTFIRPLMQTFGPKFLKSEQIFENRNELMKKKNDSTPVEPDKEIYLPKEPVIWLMNHHFKDDVLASTLATRRHAYLFMGSIPQIYNTLDGLLAYLVGFITCNRKSDRSKICAHQKGVYVINHGCDLLVAPEGIFGKNANDIMRYLWEGSYRMANETGAKLVPIVHYIYDITQQLGRSENPIHTVIDEPIDLTSLKGMSKDAALDYCRDVMATWYYLMMEKYGETTREMLLNNGDNVCDVWEKTLIDLLENAQRYDSSIETAADYRPKHIIRPENVFQPIAGIIPQEEQKYNEICQLVRQRQREDYQRRF